ncbi:MAG: type II secretion system protein [Bacteroidota bacterium]|nr:type II secretion system protein [Bacteroidota bacterium]
MFKKKSFTMIELIFVIVVIGVLAAVALPKFSSITENSKVNAEIATMDNLAAALTWSKQKYSDINTINWSGGNDGNKNTFDFDKDGYEESYLNGKLMNLHFPDEDEEKLTQEDRATAYDNASTKGTLFSAVSKGGSKGMKIVAYLANSVYNGDDIVVMTGKASHRLLGVIQPTVKESGANRDLTGKPDKNDFWVFNSRSKTIVISDGNDTFPDTEVSPYSVKLVDVNGIGQTNYEDLLMALVN